MRRNRGRCNAYVQASTRWAAERREISLSFVVRADDAVSVTEQSASGFGQIEFLVDAQEERRPNFFFELSNVDAYSGLSQMYTRGGLGKRAGIGNGFEGSEKPEFHEKLVSVPYSVVRGP